MILASDPVDLIGSPPPAEWGVAVDLDAIERLAASWVGDPFELPGFDYDGTPDRRHADWWFDYVTLSVSVLACLWPLDGHDVWQCEHHGTWLDDAPGIFAAFTRELHEHGLDLDRIAGLSTTQGSELFAGRGDLQLVPERVDRLRRVATALNERWRGSAANLVAAANRNGSQIVELLVDTIPGYRDRPATRAGIARFDKLAHLAAAIMAAGIGWTTGGFHGYDDFPVYPDYMLPRVFRHFGAMVYAPDLAERVDRREIIEAGSMAEHAIRWATVHCGAELTRSLAALGRGVNGPALDYKLWSIAVLGPEADSFGEHHRTVTLNY